MNWITSIARLLRLLPSSMRGKQRLARWLLNWHPCISGPLCILTRHGHRIHLPNAQEPIAFSLLISGDYEPEVLALLWHRLHPGDTALDIGANVGVFTLPLATRVGPSGKVIAVEASPPVFQYLDRNVRENQLTNVLPLHAAAADQPGEVSFFEAPAHSFGMSGLGNLAGSTTHRVSARTVDEIVSAAGCERVAAMKVDVEGFEVLVFKGARGLIERRELNFIVFEFLDWAEERVPGGKPGDAQRYLRDSGFQLWRLEDYDRGRPPLNHILETGGGCLWPSGGER